jgi:cyanophycinase-like exopeptidase
VAHYPQDLGFGIDENTAMIVEGREFRVVGEGERAPIVEKRAKKNGHSKSSKQKGRTKG